MTIAAVYPNGTMLVRGEKQLRLNRGDEFIRLSGIVRQVDIGADNRVASTRVADAQITYTGKRRDRAGEPPGLAAAFLLDPQPVLRWPR